MAFYRRSLLKNRTLNNWFGFFVALCIVVCTVWVSNGFVRQLRIEETKKVETMVKALQLLSAESDKSDFARALALKITEDNTTIPLLLVDENNHFSAQKNMDKEELSLMNDSVFLREKIRSMSADRPPIEVDLPFGTQRIYYEHSFLLTQLRYYPILLIVIIVLFVLFSFWYFNMLRSSQQSYLWAGMAKETAHQIGTPLSSILGWVEVLKMENVDPDMMGEMEKDVQRLNQIALRFSKIGSRPELEEGNVVEVTKNTFDYLSKRISSQIDFTFSTDKPVLLANINQELLSWVLENLIKNAVDAMSNKGKISVRVRDKNTAIVISIRDNGPGIPKAVQRRIFEPGYTTKKRGWGLGLSLAKRIVKDYHKGKIYVASSEKGQGTEFRIELIRFTPKNLAH